MDTDMGIGLKDLLNGAEVTGNAGGDDVLVSALTLDSRTAGPGSLFFAVPGTVTDGHDYIGAAVAAGAAAVVCERLPEDIDPQVCYVTVRDSRRATGIIASAFYGNPSSRLRLVGVTGTNGKTTVATLLYDLFRMLGYRAGLISTVSYKVDTEEIPSTHTTPDAIRLNAMMAEMAERGCEYCFMEVSSHSVVQERIAGLEFAGGVFTNITHEHLDYHKTFAEYIRAKKTFFDSLPAGAFALINADDRNGRVMMQNTRAKTAAYSLQSFADFRCRIMESTPEGMLLEMDGEQVWTKFMGRFNASNLAAVYGAARLLGADRREVLTAISALRPVSGRFEAVRSAGSVTAIIDYAHTPDALRNAIDTINDMRQGGGRLFVVVGCGGDRDKAKRPEMARIAVEGADRSIFTSDNPRSEKPEDILADMAAGVTPSNRWLTIADRGEAIKAAAMMAESGDIILIAGKGHETYQITDGGSFHFDDREEIMKHFNALG